MPLALLLIAATHPLAQASGLDLAYVTSFGDGTWARPTHAVLVVEEGLEVLLVVDNANGRVLKLRSGDGKVIGSFGEGDGAESVHAPTCLATDGKVLVPCSAAFKCFCAGFSLTACVIWCEVPCVDVRAAGHHQVPRFGL